MYYCYNLDGKEEMENGPAEILILNNTELFRQICSDKNISKEMTTALKKTDGIGAFMLFTLIENVPVGFNASELLKNKKADSWFYGLGFWTGNSVCTDIRKQIL